MGRDLKNAFVEAGFVDVEWSASFDVFSTPEDAAFFHAFVNEWFLSDEVISQATQAGLATREQFEMCAPTWTSGRTSRRSQRVGVRRGYRVQALVQSHK